MKTVQQHEAKLDKIRAAALPGKSAAQSIADQPTIDSRVTLTAREIQEIVSSETRPLLKAVGEQALAAIYYDTELKIQDKACEILVLDNKDLQAEVEQLKHDIHAYRGALGYAVPGSHDGKLSDGTTPKCGFCDGVKKRAEAAHTITDLQIAEISGVYLHFTDAARAIREALVLAGCKVAP